MRFFYLELRIRRLFPGLRPLEADPLPPEQARDPFAGEVREQTALDQVAPELLHRPLGVGKPEIRRPGKSDLDHFPELLARQHGRPAIGVRGIIETRQTVFIEMGDPVIDAADMHPGALSDLRDGVPSLRNCDHAIPHRCAPRPLVPKLLPQQLLSLLRSFRSWICAGRAMAPPHGYGPRYEPEMLTANNSWIGTRRLRRPGAGEFRRWLATSAWPAVLPSAGNSRYVRFSA